MPVKFLSTCGLILMLSMFAGCGTPAPRSFSTVQGSMWSIVEIRDGLSYSRAWDTTVDILVRNFDLDAAIREEGYIRTGWMHSWSGEYMSCYRVRVTVKFSPDRKTLRFRSEAQFLYDNEWITGTDDRLVKTLKADFMGTVGRTSR